VIKKEQKQLPSVESPKPTLSAEQTDYGSNDAMQSLMKDGTSNSEKEQSKFWGGPDKDDLEREISRTLGCLAVLTGRFTEVADHPAAEAVIERTEELSGLRDFVDDLRGSYTGFNQAYSMVGGLHRLDDLRQTYSNIRSLREALEHASGRTPADPEDWRARSAEISEDMENVALAFDCVDDGASALSSLPVVGRIAGAISTAADLGARGVRGISSISALILQVVMYSATAIEENLEEDSHLSPNERVGSDGNPGSYRP